MIQKPPMYAAENAEPFKDSGVVQAYRHRPPYPAEVFEILRGLVGGDSGAQARVLDAGCGTGDLARLLVALVDRVDAVDFSPAMIAQGRALAQGDHPALHWHGERIEELPDWDLAPPYHLVTAGESLHWMDWTVVLPRFRRLLLPGGYLAIVERRTIPDPWSMLGDIVERYRTDGGYQPYNMLQELERHGLFEKVGAQETAASAFEQPIAEYVESYHSRSGFSRQRMGAVRAAAFDLEAREHLQGMNPTGVVPLQLSASVVWGLPAG